MRGRAPDPGRSVKAIKRDKQRHYAGLEYYGMTADMSWFKRKPYDIKQNRTERERTIMTGNEYQDLAMRTFDGEARKRLDAPIGVYNVDPQQLGEIDIPALINGVLGLTGEAGEVSDLVKKGIFNEKGLDMDHIKKEVGDVCWYLALICKACCFDLDSVLETNVEKLKNYYPDGFDVERANHRKAGDI